MNYQDIIMDGDTKDLRNPDFKNKTRVHDWRNYIPQDVCEVWADLDFNVRVAFYVMAETQARNEEWE